MMNKEERVLSALSDLTNGALNYYQAPQTVMVKESIIREYIQGLQQQNKDLQQRIDKALNFTEKQKKKMYKNRNKIALFNLIKIQEILGGKE